MARQQLDYMTVERRTAWGIPADQYRDYQTLFAAAETALQLAMDKAERTHVITVRCGQAFDELTEKMRFFKDRYFKIPPLTPENWAALGFSQKDEHPTPSQPPTGVPGPSLSYPGGPHSLTLHLGPLPGTAPLDSDDYGYAIYTGLMPPGGATLEQAASAKHYLMSPPGDGDGLLHHRFTRRRKEPLSFESSEAGMTLYACCRYENQRGFVGKWGPVVSAIVP
jgi:hypothetical protein